jgi:DNA-binding transcriptional LysR family regulator
MDLHHLRHFLAVAEELHFGRAAKRLGMSQPPLSQSIQRLETSLGATLFDRSRQHVVLTPAGRALLPEARGLLAQVEQAERLVRRVAEGNLARLRVAFVPWSLVRALPRALRAFHRQWPGVEARLYERASRQQVASLRAGEIDLAIVSLRMIDTGGLQVRVVERSRLAVAVPSSWPQAEQARLRLADLAACPFLVFPPQLSPAWHEAVIAACRDAGFRPNVIQETAQPFTMLNMVANGLGVALLQDTAASMKVDGVTLVPLADAPASFDTEIALAWTDKTLTPPLASFIAHVEREAAGDTGVG